MPTPAQRTTLKAIAAGEVRMVNRGYSALRIEGAVPQVVGRVISLGWARWPRFGVSDEVCELTEKGRAVLSNETAIPPAVARES